MNQRTRTANGKKDAGKKKPSMRVEFRQFVDSLNNFLMKRFTDSDSFNRTVDASIGTILDLCYEKGVFTKEEFEKTVSKAMQTNTFQNIISDCKRIDDDGKVVERIIHGMANLNIDRDHELLKVENLTKLFNERAETILQLLDEKLADLVKAEEEENDGRPEVS